MLVRAENLNGLTVWEWLGSSDTCICVANWRQFKRGLQGVLTFFLVPSNTHLSVPVYVQSTTCHGFYSVRNWPLNRTNKASKVAYLDFSWVAGWLQTVSQFRYY
jgi:hypothetical protein